MSLSSFTYRLKAQSGQSNPVDEKGGATLTGATQTLVDRGSEGFAWQFATGISSAAIPSKTTSPTIVGGGVTVARKIKILNYGTLDYMVLMGLGSSVVGANDAFPGNGLVLNKTASNFIQSSQKDSTYTPQRALAINTEITVITRFTCGVGSGNGFQRLDVWYSGGSGDTPEASSALNNVAAQTINTFSVNASNGASYQISDFVIWNEELTDAQCRALATDLRGTIDAVPVAPGAPTIGTATAGNGQVSCTFTAPSSNGGATISGYTMTAYKVSDNTVAGSNAGTSSPIVVTVANGTAVYLKAKATNSAGTGAESSASNSVTPVAVNQAPIFTGTINNIVGTNGVAISNVDVHTLFSDPDTNTLTYSASPAGTAWPSGLVVNSSTGVISGTVATSTTTGLRVRASDGSLTVDSNAFSVTVTATAIVSYIDLGTTEKCDNISSGVLATVALTAVVMRRDDLTVAKQVITGLTTDASGNPPSRFAVSLPVGTPVHILFITTADNTVSGAVSNFSTVS